MTTYDFPRSYHLLNSREFAAVFNNASLKIHSTYFLILGIKNVCAHPRLGCVVSKKNAKHAVSRNRIKRIVREGFRLHKHNLAAFDLVVLAKPTTAKQHNTTLVSDLDGVWNKDGLVMVS